MPHDRRVTRKRKNRIKASAKNDDGKNFEPWSVPSQGGQCHARPVEQEVLQRGEVCLDLHAPTSSYSTLWRYEVQFLRHVYFEMGGGAYGAAFSIEVYLRQVGFCDMHLRTCERTVYRR